MIVWYKCVIESASQSISQMWTCELVSNLLSDECVSDRKKEKKKEEEDRERKRERESLGGRVCKWIVTWVRMYLREKIGE